MRITPGTVFKQELSYSTFQEEQLRVLRSLADSFDQSLSKSVSIGRSLNSISVAVNTIANSIVSKFSAGMESSSRIVTSAAHSYASGLEQQVVILDQFGKEIKSSAETYKDTLEEISDKNKEEFNKGTKSAEEFFTDIKKKAFNMLEDLAKSANNYSTLTNSLMKFTGVDRTTAKDFRGVIVEDIVGQLNSETGSFFNAQDVYRQMVAISDQASIGNAETLKEITRPIALAAESMNIHTGDLSVLLGRWHTRYNFSSAYMEGIVDDIRSSTAGNQASAQATVENLAKLETSISTWANGDADALAKASEEIANFTAYAESMGINSSTFTEWMDKIISGEAKLDPTLVNLLHRGGLTSESAQSLGRNLELVEVGKALLKGVTSVGEQAKTAGGGLTAPVLEVLGLDYKETMDTYNAMTSENAKTYEDFLKTIDPTTAVEAIGEQYVSATDKIHNTLSGIAAHVASIQEFLGVGLSDILTVLAAGLGVKAGIKALGKVGGSAVAASGGGILQSIGRLIGLGGGAAAAGGATTILGVLGPIAAIAAGVGLLAKISSDNNKDKAKNAEEMFSQISSGKKSALAKDIVWDEATGDTKTVWSWKDVNAEDYNLEEQLALNQEYYNTAYSWWDKFLGKGGTSAQRSTEKYMKFMADLDDKQSEVVAAYSGKGLFKDKKNTVVIDSFIDNFDKVYNAYWSETPQVYDLSAFKTLTAFNGASPLDRMEVWGYETGTNYIHRDQLAYLHEGEAVVPKKYNPLANITELEALRESAKNNEAKENNNDSRYKNALIETAQTLEEIKEFLAVWKENNDRKDISNSAKNKFAAARIALSSYYTEA